MDGARFDRLARRVATSISRRGLLTVAAGLAIGRVHRASGSQLTPSTCGASGDVCTMLVGCCDGLTCVTSAINTNYGVCVAGEGGTVSIGTTLISPFSENVEAEVAAIAAAETTDTTSTTTTTDSEVEREQRIADRKARRSTRRNTKQSKNQTQQTEQQNRREDRRDARDLRRGPKIELNLFNAGGGDGKTETVRVANQDDTSIALIKIESLLNPSDNLDLTRTVNAGASFNFYSGPAGSIFDNDEMEWKQLPICTSSAGDGAGFRVYAGFSATTDIFKREILCDGSNPGVGDGKPRRQKRGRNGSKNKNKNRKGG